LSTTAASIAGTLAVTGNATFDTNTLFVDAANDKVSIGNTIPSSFLSNGNQLVVGSGAAAQGITIYSDTAGTGNLFFADGTAGDTAYRGFLRYDHVDDAMKIYTNGGNEYMRITSDGYVRLATNGIQFNGDTAAAYALDDYEEGTWTMGVSFGGAAAGVTYSENTGTYTKIGRQVTVNGYMALTSKGSSTGAARVTGLPFTIGSGDSYYAAASFRLNNITFTNQFQGFADPNTTTIRLEEVTILGANTGLTDADFADNSIIMVSQTYFV
jgi:hypothetical protein